MDKHIIEMNDEEWLQYILETAKTRLRENSDMTDIRFDTNIRPLRIISIENGRIQLGFKMPPDKLQKLSEYINDQFSEELGKYFSEIMHETCSVEVMPVYVN